MHSRCGKVWLAAGLVLMIGWSIACADFHRGTPADASGGVVDDPVFENGVYAVMQASCIFCHFAGEQASSTRLVMTANAKADRAMVVRLVTPGNPDSSLLLQKATGNSHGGGTRLIPDTTDYNTIRDWIANLPRGH